MNQGIRARIFILFIIFLEGFVSISVEILTIRQLIPVVGTSVIVTSLIIGIFLLFLAFGYWKGGRYKGDVIPILRRNFIIAGGLTGIGLSYLFIISFLAVIEHYVVSAFLFILVIYLLLIIAPIIYLLGQTVPLTMNLMNPKKRTAETGGNVLFLSTLGSFLGALLTSLFLMEIFGVAWTVFINFFILIMMVFLFFKNRKKEIIYILLSIAIGWLVYNINIVFEQNHFIKTTNYANYLVRNGVEPDSGQNGKILESNNFMSPSTFLFFA